MDGTRFAAIRQRAKEKMAKGAKEDLKVEREKVNSLEHYGTMATALPCKTNLRSRPWPR